MSLIVPVEVKEALAECRNDSSDVNFVVVGYDPTAEKTLALFGKGSDGVQGMHAFCKGDEVNYCLLRVDYNFETAGNVKAKGTRFLFIYVRPESTPLKIKKTLGSVEGQVKTLFSPFIRTVEVENAAEVTEQRVSDIIDQITMKKDNVTEKKAMDGMLVAGQFFKNRTQETDKKDAILAWDSSARLGSTAGAEVSFADPEVLKAMVTSVRDDANPMKWCLFGYVDKKSIGFVASGEGDVTEMLSNCPDDKICYGIFRVLEEYSRGNEGEWSVSIDQVRFGMLTWVPPNVSPILKAVVSTHKGVVNEAFRPFHHQFYVSDRSELDNQKVMDAFMSITGTKSKVTNKKTVVKEEKYERKFIGGASSTVQTLNFINKDALIAAIKDVRTDSSETTWTVGAFVGDKKALSFELVASGTGINALQDALTEDSIQYILYKAQTMVDKYSTTKFYLIKYEGSKVPIGLKGSAGIFHGAVTEVYGAAHATAEVGDRTELLKKLGL